MRLQKIGTYYHTCLRQFYAARPALIDDSYAAQHAALMAECFGSSNFWTVALEGIGYTTSEVVANAEPMQKHWAREQNLNYDEQQWVLEIAAAQIKAFQPEVLIVADYVTFTAEFLRQLRRECASICVVVGACGAPYSDPAVFRQYDVIVSPIPELVEHFTAGGHRRARHLNHAFDPRVLERINTQKAPQIDFAFVGSIFKAKQFHHEREKILVDLTAKTNLQMWADVPRVTSQERRRMMVRRWAYDAVRAARQAGVPQTLLTGAPLIRRVAHWETRPHLSPPIVDETISRRANSPLFGLAMFQQLRDSRVVLNTHIDIAPRSASNVRLFEATGVGSCMLTDWKANLPDLFEPDVEAVAYHSSEECVEKVQYLLTHNDARQKIALAGQRRTLRDHTFERRAALLHQIISEAL